MSSPLAQEDAVQLTALQEQAGVLTGVMPLSSAAHLTASLKSCSSQGAGLS